MLTEQIVEHGKIDLIVGTLFVLFHSANRFNTPWTNRSSTTAGRFFLALGVYCLAALITYLLLVDFPHLVTLLAAGQPAALPAFMEELSSPLVMALLMTTLLPKLPLLSTVDQWILRQLRGMAAIPHEVRRLTAELRRQSLALRPEVREDVRTKLLSDGIDPQDIRFETGSEPAQLWTGVTALLVQVENWESDRRMAGYVERYGEYLTRLRERHEALTPKARACFRLMRQSGADEESEKTREAVQRYVDAFADDVTAIRKDLLDFISRGILASEFTDAARGNRLAALGFTAGTGNSIELTLNQMMSLFAVFGILVLSSFALSSGRQDVSQGVLLSRVIMISLIYSVAVACVVLPRQSWRIARWEPGMPRPVAFYLLAGLLSVAMTQAISFGFNVALAGSFAAGVDRQSLTFPWSVMTFTTAVMTAFLIDDRPPAHVSPRVWRLIEGVIGAVSMTLAAAQTHGWLVDRVKIVGPEIVESLHYVVPPLGAVLLPAGAVGFAVGYLVPSWFRKVPQQPRSAATAVLSGAV